MGRKTWKDTIGKGLAAALILFSFATTASAVPVISVDLDPGTAGIQSTLSVLPGSSFTIDMVLTGDGVTLFDTFAFAADFNDAGAVLGLFGGTGSPTAGSIVGLAPILAVDAFTAAPVGLGSPLTPIPFPLTPGFTASSGAVGIASLGLPFGPVPIPAGVTIDLFSLTLVAMAPGTSDVIPNAGGVLGGLALGGLSVPFTAVGATVTVIPVPAAIWFFGTALIGLVGFAKRKANLTP